MHEYVSVYVYVHVYTTMFLMVYVRSAYKKTNLNSCLMLQQDEIPMGFFVSDQLLEKLTNRVSTRESERDTERK